MKPEPEDHAPTTAQASPGSENDTNPLHLCGAAHPTELWFCTRVARHHGRHIAAIGPWMAGVPVLAEWDPSEVPFRRAQARL